MNKKPIWHRHEAKVGQPMLVNLPTGKEWENSGEGGLAFFLVVPKKEGEQRCVCIVGELFWPLVDVCVAPPGFMKKKSIDAGLLIGSTGQSLWSKEDGEYFHPTFEDLTEEGKALYRGLKKMYGEVVIVTLLDT